MQTSSDHQRQAAPYYLAVSNEIDIFTAAFNQKLPLMLKGPTGCGKTRLVEYMAHKLQVPLVTVACHEDITAGDLVGRYLLSGGETVWVDGPLTRAVKQGGICYLDEVVEARSDTTVVIHPLADHRRELNIERLGTTLQAPDNFMLIVSYNPGYQSILKDLKQSTRQRMVSMEMGYPSTKLEVAILMKESGIDSDTAQDLVKLANGIRSLGKESLPEVASTRTLISCARLIKEGLPPREAASVAVLLPLCDEGQITADLGEIVASYLKE